MWFFPPFGTISIQCCFMECGLPVWISLCRDSRLTLTTGKMGGAPEAPAVVHAPAVTGCHGVVVCGPVSGKATCPHSSSQSISHAVFGIAAGLLHAALSCQIVSPVFIGTKKAAWIDDGIPNRIRLGDVIRQAGDSSWHTRSTGELQKPKQGMAGWPVSPAPPCCRQACRFPGRFRGTGGATGEVEETISR